MVVHRRAIVRAAGGIASAAVVFLAARSAWRAVATRQQADSTVDASVQRPAYRTAHPRVAIDEGHHNRYAATGAFGPLASLLRSDGYDVRSLDRPLSVRALDSVRVLVIADAMGAPFAFMDAAHHPAFTSAECDAVAQWVEGGGALLLVADRPAAGNASQELANRFGVRMSARALVDSLHAVLPLPGERRNDDWLVFSRDNYMLGAHAVVEGRDSTERVRRVVTFGGQSFLADANAVPILRVSDAAGDVDPASGFVTAG